MKRYQKALCCLLTALLLIGCAGSRKPPVAERPTAAPAAIAAAAAPTSPIGGMLVGPAARWRYSAGKGDPSPADEALWRQSEFNDAAWASASGSFGAKDGILAAMGDYMPAILLPMEDANGKRIPAYFFRASFFVDDPAQIPALEGALAYDDAAVVYINGVTVFEGNVPEGGLDGNLSFGAKNAQDAPRTGSFLVAADMLRAGVNTLAVEVHQAAETSSDVYFGFSGLLAAENRGTLSIADFCLFTGGGDALTARWFGGGRNMTLRYAPSGGGSYPASAQKVPAAYEETEWGFRYSASIGGLAPDTDYTLWVEDGVGRTEEVSFSTPAQDSFSFLLAGDPQLTGETAAAALTKAFAAFDGVSFALCAGDQVNSTDDVSQYRLFLDAAGASELPVAAVIGNHESPALYDAFLAPTGLPAYMRSFRFVYGDTLFVCLDSNSDDFAGQEAFLRESIASGTWDWVIVSMHHSLFSRGSHADSDSIAALRARYAPLFTACDVDLVLSGHDHIYARTKLMENAFPVSEPDGGADALQKVRGQTLYVSAGSSTGSKYYERETEDNAPFAAVSEEGRPTLTHIDIDAERIRITSLYADDLSPLDEVTLTRATAASAAADASTAQIRAQLLESEKAFLLSTQLANGAFATYPAMEGENAVNPYFADYTAMALLKVGETEAVRRYLDWRFSHLNTAESDVNGLAYTAYDYTLTVQGGAVVYEQATGSYDSTDSYAATLITLMRRYLDVTGDVAYVCAHYEQLAGAAQVLLATTDAGLTVARPDYRVQYLMDNCEVGYALHAADALLSPALLSSLDAAEAAEAALLKRELSALCDTVTLGIERRLWNNEEARYESSVQPDGYVFPYDPARFYPDAIAQLAPIVFGQLGAQSARATRLYETFCDSWDWAHMAHVTQKATDHCWGMLAYCAAVRGDGARLSDYLNAYAERYAATHPYPLHNADAAWVVLACAYGK